MHIFEKFRKCSKGSPFAYFQNFFFELELTPNIDQHAHQREYILIDTKIVKIGYPEAELGQEGHLTLLDLM